MGADMIIGLTLQVKNFRTHFFAVGGYRAAHTNFEKLSHVR